MYVWGVSMWYDAGYVWVGMWLDPLCCSLVGICGRYMWVYGCGGNVYECVCGEGYVCNMTRGMCVLGERGGCWVHLVSLGTCGSTWVCLYTVTVNILVLLPSSVFLIMRHCILMLSQRLALYI